MMLSIDLSGIPEHLWLIGAVVVALGGLCIRLFVVVQGIKTAEDMRERIDDERRNREQAVWKAWEVESETRRQQMQALVQQVMELQTQNGQLNKTIFDLQRDLANVTIENITLKVKVDDLDKHNHELQDQMNEVAKVVQ